MVKLFVQIHLYQLERNVLGIMVLLPMFAEISYAQIMMDQLQLTRIAMTKIQHVQLAVLVV